MNKIVKENSNENSPILNDMKLNSNAVTDDKRMYRSKVQFLA